MFTLDYKEETDVFTQAVKIFCVWRRCVVMGSSPFTSKNLFQLTVSKETNLLKSLPIGNGSLAKKRYHAFAAERRGQHCRRPEPRMRQIGAVVILPYTEFLDKLWNGEFSE
jgi:hypothetical protein